MMKQSTLFGETRSEEFCCKCGKPLTGSVTSYSHEGKNYCKDHLPSKAKRKQPQEEEEERDQEELLVEEEEQGFREVDFRVPRREG